MCGIAGGLYFKGKKEWAIKPLLDLMRQRGPDESAFIEQDLWSIGANRLAITAPQEKNTQPLWSPDKRFCFVFNGEIYNHKEIKQELSEKGWRFKSASDTEALFYSYLEYGDEAFLKCQGMFAMAIFDTLAQKWILARDPFGIKPLYYQMGQHNFAFASEIKPLLWLKKPSINKKALPSYLERRFVLGKETLFEGLFRVLPGEIIEVSLKGKIKTKKYWDPKTVPPSVKSKKERFKEFSKKLEESIRLSSQSESGLSVLFSGGLDSSLINVLSSSFNISMEAWLFDSSPDKKERALAEKLCQKLNQKLNIVRPEPKDFLLLPKIINSLEEPLGDSIIVPTYKLMREVSKKERVLLSGEGADELLGGYVHHLLFYLFQKMGRLRRFFSSMINSLPESFLNALFPYPGTIKKNSLQSALSLMKKSGLKSFIEWSHLFSSKEINKLIPGFLESIKNASSADKLSSLKNLESRSKGFSYPETSSLKDLLIFDIQNWLANYNLLRIDKLSMAHSLEARVPYLNLSFASFCLSLPERDILSFGIRKKILREFAQKKSALDFKTAYRKKHPFTFKEMTVYDDSYIEFIQDHLDESFRKKWDIPPQALNQLTQPLWQNPKRLTFKKRATPPPSKTADFNSLFSQKSQQNKGSLGQDLIAQKQITSLLHLSLWTKEFF